MATKALQLRAADGTIYSLARGKVHVIGRAEGVDLRLAGFIDRRHTELDFRGDECLVKDLGSTSGTYLNDYIVRKAMALKKGDKLRIGSHVLMVEGSV